MSLSVASEVMFGSVFVSYNENNPFVLAKVISESKFAIEFYRKTSRPDRRIPRKVSSEKPITVCLIKFNRGFTNQVQPRVYPIRILIPLAIGNRVNWL